MFHDPNTEQAEPGVCFMSEAYTSEETPDLILNRTRPRQEQPPFPTPLPFPPCLSRRSRELHIRRLENDMINQGVPDPFLAAFIKCTSDHSESSDADSDWSSRRSGGRGSSCSSPSSPRNVLWQQVKAYFSSRARKERKRKSKRSRVGSIGRDSGDDRSRTSSSSVYVQTRYN